MDRCGVYGIGFAGASTEPERKETRWVSTELLWAAVWLEYSAAAAE